MATVDPPENLFHRLDECLVLSLRHCARHRTLTLVTEYPLKLTSPESERDFVALVFHGVQVSGMPANYRADERPGPVVVHGLEAVATKGSARGIAIDLGSRLGCLTFGYRSLTAKTRGSRVARTGHGFEYRDVESGERFDMYEPFPELDCEALP
jgi:hypothetical protein